MKAKDSNKYSKESVDKLMISIRLKLQDLKDEKDTSMLRLRNVI